MNIAAIGYPTTNANKPIETITTISCIKYRNISSTTYRDEYSIHDAGGCSTQS